MVLASAIEAPIALISDRFSRARIVAMALFVLAFALAACALAEEAWLLSLGLALAGAASGVGCAAAEAELVSTYPGGPSRAMSRWIAFGAVGDLLAPLVVAGVLALGASHRAALFGIAALIALHGLRMARAAARAERAVEPARHAAGGDEAPEPTLTAALRSALAMPRLWWLLFATAACTLLDEIVVAFAALRLHGDLHWSEAAVAAMLSACSFGAVLGALATERLLARFTPAALLSASALAALIALGVFATTHSAAVAAGALFVIGVAAAPHYPLAQAAAYELVPGRPGLVNALAQLFVLVDLASSLAVGVIAARFGLSAAILSLGLQPLVILAVAVSLYRRA